MRSIKILVAAVLLGTLPAVHFSCTRNSVDPGDSTSDQEALLTAYRQLATALESGSAGSDGLDGLLSAGYLDEGADRDTVLTEAASYFSAYDSIRVSLNTQGMVPRIVRDRAVVAESLKIESWFSAIPGSVMVEWATGNAYWIFEDDTWKLYGDQTDSTPAAAVDVAPRADVSALTGIFGPAGTALGIADAVIANVLFDSGAVDQYSVGGWPAVTRTTYYFPAYIETTYLATVNDSTVSVTDTVRVETTAVDSVIIDYDSLDIAVVPDGIGRNGTVRIGCSTVADTAGSFDIGFALRSCTAGSSSLFGSGTMSGTTDSLTVYLNIYVDSVQVVYNGAALVNAGTPDDRSDDVIRFGTAEGINQIINGSAGTWNMRIFLQAPTEPRYGMGLSPQPVEYALVYDRFAVHPVKGCLFADSLSASAVGSMGYADLLDALNTAWVDPLTGEAYPESVSVYYTEERRHRKGPWGISGFIDNGFDVLPIIPDQVRDQDRAGDMFLAGACYGWPLYAGDGTAVIRLVDVTVPVYTVIDSAITLCPR